MVHPREDLREGKPLDASEFAVHLDHIREGRDTVSLDYREPSRFFERNYWTKSMRDVAAQVARRLSGVTVETSPVFNLATQFGGGKTHALTALYHLAQGGPAANGWRGIDQVLSEAGIPSMPKANVAVLVGERFDSLTGAGGDGEPLRKTPWGEIAWQLGGASSFAAVAEHDAKGVAPAGKVIEQMLPNSPCLILLDELMPYIDRERRLKTGLAGQLYTFLHSLTEEVRARDDVVLAVSLPGSVLEMTPEVREDYERLRKLLERVGKGVVMSADAEIPEIIRRRLFDWGGLPKEGRDAAQAYADWVAAHRDLVPISPDTAYQRFAAAYPFHPALLSVFERKWQTLQHFQRTRGILRILALWVSWAYQQDHQKVYPDPVIGLGAAPLQDPQFRQAVLEQLGNTDLEGPVTTDIAGHAASHAIRLDQVGDAATRKARLHQKTATAILFESNGGQTSDAATVPELRFAVASPDVDIASVETALEELSSNCYYLTVEGSRYRFRPVPNLNKVYTDRRATIGDASVRDRVRQTINQVFKGRPSGLELVPFPQVSSDVPNRAALTLVVLDPEQIHGDPATQQFIEQTLRECGSSGRTFKSALLFAVATSPAPINDAARKLCAWEAIADDHQITSRLDEAQKAQLSKNQQSAERELTEAAWRAYRYVVLLNKDNVAQAIDLGHVTSSAGTTMAEVIVNRLLTDDQITKLVSPRLLTKNWPDRAAWSTKEVRDVFFASPRLPRLLDASVLRRTISDGVAQGLLAYAVRDNGGYAHVRLQESLNDYDVEFSEDTVILRPEDVPPDPKQSTVASVEVSPPQAALKPGETMQFTASCLNQHGQRWSEKEREAVWSATGGQIDSLGRFTATDEGTVQVTATIGEVTGSATVTVRSEAVEPQPPQPGTGLRWSGTIPPQKWMNFYTKVLTKFVQSGGLTVEVGFRVKGSPVTDGAIEDTKMALRELGLDDRLSPD